jgi:hypothetical protein
MTHLLSKQWNVLTETSVATLAALMGGARADAPRNSYDKVVGSLENERRYR